MNKNKITTQNTLDNKTKSNKTMHEVGIKTNFYVTKNTDIYAKIRVIGSRNREKEVSVPASTMMYWYPFYFYYDWGFKANTNKWVLKIADNAPETSKPYMKKDLFFTDCVNLKTYETHDNKIYRDNLALMNSLDEVSKGTFSTLLSTHIDKYSLRYNNEFIASTIESIKQKCKVRYDDAYVKHFADEKSLSERFEVLSVMDTARDRLLYDKYATDEELSMLIKMGAASRVTYVLSKLYGEI